MKEFSKLASELGFEYNVLEGFWSRWPERDLKELVEYSRELGVGILIWKHSRDLRTPDQSGQFFSLCNRTGVVGAKIDFFDHEHKEIIDLYETILRAAAEHKILVDFHGSNKPTGLERTWPNLIGLEGIRGMESRPPYAQHDATLPFTRMIAGLADYTPTHFGRRMADTTWAHQVANAILFPAPLLVYGAHPATIIENPAAGMIRSIPSTWDQTVVLPASDIGEVAVLARRKGSTWFIAAANGVYARTIRIDLSFLGEGSYLGFLIRDGADATSVRTEQVTLRRTDSLHVQMPSGGGFVGRFKP
jgi:alpha-glucosidase